MTCSKTIFLSLFLSIYACIITSSAEALPEVVDPQQNWRKHEFWRYKGAGREAYEDKEFAKAAEYFRQALTFNNEDDTSILEANCLMEMKDWVGAKEILKSVFEKRGYKHEFELLIQCELSLKQGSDALITCDAFQRNCPINEAVWIQRAKIYLFQGKRALAVQSLRQGYEHCLRTGDDATEIRYALKRLHESVPATPQIIRAGNTQVLELVRYLCDLKSPVNEEVSAASFERITGRKLEFVFDGTLSNWSVSDWSAVATFFDLATDELRCRLNPDLSFVTREDLIGAHLLIENTSLTDPSASLEKNVTVVGLVLGATKPPDIYRVMKLNDGELKLTFNGNAPMQLTEVARSFPPSTVKKFAMEDFDQTMSHARELIEAGQLQEASAYLLRHWQSRHIDMMEGKLQKVALSKSLLAESLSWKPETAQYVAEAPFWALTHDIGIARFDVNKLPTIETFRKHRWFAQTKDPRRLNGQPQISVNLEDYNCGMWLSFDMPYYEKILAEIGERKPNTPAVYIKPISGEDADYCMFHYQ